MKGTTFCVVMPWKMELVEQLWEDIRAGVDLLGGAIGVIPAFGVSPIDDIEFPPEMYCDRATLALSHAAGRNNIVIYDPGMEDNLEDEMRLLMEINEALDRDEFTFYAQPQCDIFTGKVVGAESLVRWNHSTKGLIPPGRFVPAMERGGTIYLLDQRVWEKVCQWMRSWIDGAIIRFPSPSTSPASTLCRWMCRRSSPGCWKSTACPPSTSRRKSPRAPVRRRTT